MQRGTAGSVALLCLPDATTEPKKQSRASKYITMRQATSIMEAVRFAKLIDLPLVAHLTIHWSLTDVGDDPDGKLFAKVREGLDNGCIDTVSCSQEHGHANAKREGNPTSCIATCSSTCRSNTAWARSYVRSRRRFCVS